jgi:hypothetical protein
MSVPAWIDELDTSSLTTRLAKGMTRLNPRSSKVRVTNSRDARGAVGCGARCSRSTARMGVDNTADNAEKIDSLTIR